MFEKNMHISFLLDFYGGVLADRTRDVLEMYYFDDMSLAEIADTVGITRQGVRGGIKKGEEELLFLEEKLGLAARYSAITESAKRLLSLAEDLKAETDPKQIKALLDEIVCCTDSVLAKEKED
ncbi:MAG: DNA-binding protein [Ruminococcaceae bacterium]|nr:DNA-binding protein [Oscillospiraceae bacterium]